MPDEKQVTTLDNLIKSTILTQDETDIVHKLLNSKDPANTVIPDNMESGDLWQHLSATCKAMVQIKIGISRLKPLLGRMLIVCRNNPQLIKQQGYEGWNDFLTKGVWNIFGVSRAEAYGAVKVAEELGDLSLDDMASIGMSKLSIAASAIRSEAAEGTPPERIAERKKFWIDAARTDTVEELRDRAYTKGVVEEGGLEFAEVVIPCTKAQKDRWVGFVGTPEVAAYVGSQAPGSILDALIDECVSEWLAKNADAARVEAAK